MGKMVRVGTSSMTDPDEVEHMRCYISNTGKRLTIELFLRSGNSRTWNYELEEEDDSWTENTAFEKMESLFSEILEAKAGKSALVERELRDAVFRR